MVEINLLPKQYRQQAEPDVWRYASAAVAGLTVVVLAGWLLAVSGSTRRLESQITTLDQQIAGTSEGQRRYVALTANKAELEKVTVIATQLRDQKTYWSNDLAAFVSRVPGDISLTSVRLGPGQQGGEPNPLYAGKVLRRQIEATGQANSQASVVGFLNAFENDPAFGIDFRNMQRNGESGTYNFTSSVALLGDAPATPAPTPGTPTPAPTGEAASFEPTATVPAQAGANSGELR